MLSPSATLLCFFKNKYLSSSSGLSISRIRSFLPILIANVSQNLLSGESYPSAYPISFSNLVASSALKPVYKLPERVQYELI
nr:MAG TPA: hypothetical protein [Caudoviricetes sp.]